MSMPSYLDEYLPKRWPGKSLPELKNNKNTRTELIMDLKTNSGLSIRAIANLPGINRGTVQKTNDSRGLNGQKRCQENRPLDTLLISIMVRARGLEPPRLSALDPKSNASAIPPRPHKHSSL